MQSLTKLVTLSLIVFLSFSCGRACQIEVAAPNWQNVAATVMESVVRVEICETDFLALPTDPTSLIQVIKEDVEEEGPCGNDPDQKLFGIGSGFVVKEDGYVITNEHVVAAALVLDNPKIHIVFQNKKSFRVTKVAASVQHDLAILKVNVKGLTPLKIEKIAEPELGQPVAAFGNPWPFSFTVTQGIISNITQQESSLAFKWIQNTAAINGGCSGGPLVDYRGTVIGINEATGVSHGQRLEAVSLAIPAKALLEFISLAHKAKLTDLKVDDLP